MAEPLYFVSLANIKTNSQIEYERFVTAVIPIWKRHNMDVVLRLKIDADGRTTQDLLNLNDVAVLKVRSRKDFYAYIEDPDYQKIKRNRMNAVEFFAVMEGNEANLERLDEVRRFDILQVVFRRQHSFHNGISVNINHAGQVKGPISRFLKSVHSIVIEPASFEDNGKQMPNTLAGRLVR